jgi:hypothetical protein
MKSRWRTEIEMENGNLDGERLRHEGLTIRSRELDVRSMLSGGRCFAGLKPISEIAKVEGRPSRLQTGSEVREEFSYSTVAAAESQLGADACALESALHVG